MTPEMLAALAEFLGVEATPEAVAQALEGILTQLNDGSAGDEMMASLRSALGLPDTAGKADIVGKLDAIMKMMSEDGEEEDEEDDASAGKSLNFDALKRFAGLADAALNQPKPDDLPRYTGKNRFNINKGAKKPGMVEMLRNLRAGKTQSYQLGPTGGYILNHEVSSDFLPALRDAIPLFDMGVQEYTMDGVESLTIPKDGSEHEAYWVGEDTEVPESTERIGGVTLMPKPLAARVVVPNKYLSNSIVDYEARVREKVTYRIERAIMRAALYGTGGVSGSNTGQQPVGLATLSNISSRAVTRTALGTNGAIPKLKDLVDAVGRIEDANVDVDDSMSFLFSPRTKRTFVNMTGTDGHPLLRESWASGEDGALLGYNWETSNIIPNTETQGSSSDCSTIFAGVWRHMALGMSNQFEFLVDPYSRSSYLQTVIVVSTYADVAVLYDEAFEVIVGAKP